MLQAFLGTLFRYKWILASQQHILQGEKKKKKSYNVYSTPKN